MFPTLQGGVWNDQAWQTWHRDAWRPACRAAVLTGVRPYDLRHSFVSLLIHEGRSIIDIARQAGHSPTMTLDVYSHVFDEFDIAERVTAEDQIAQARRDVSGLCPPVSDKAEMQQETPDDDFAGVGASRSWFRAALTSPDRRGDPCGMIEERDRQEG